MVYRKPNREIIESFTYTYDARGNRTSKIFADGTAELYGYDDLSRLTSAVYPGGRSVQYSYDAVGNRLEMTEGTASDPLSASCPAMPTATGCWTPPTTARRPPTRGRPTATAVSTPAGLAAGYNFEENGSTAQSVADVTGRNPGEALLLGRAPGKFGGALQFVNLNTFDARRS
jgi:YD repeat-containing protein